MNAKNSTEWTQKVLERDNFTCQKCKITGIKLVAHHIKSQAQHPELSLLLSNGTTECHSCHGKEPSQLRLFRYEGGGYWWNDLSIRYSKRALKMARERRIET